MPVLQDSEDRVRYFSASSEREMKRWMEEIKKQMMFANGQGCRISHKRRMMRSPGRDDNDQSATYSDIEGDVYHRTTDFQGRQTHDLDSDSDEPRDYNEIDEWTESDHAPVSPSDSRRNMPLPLPPRAGKSDPVVKAKQGHLTKSKSDAGSDVHRPPLPVPGKSPGGLNRKPPELPLHPPEDHEEVRPMPRTPLSQPSTPTQDITNAMAGTVNALKKQFDNKPVLAPRPGAHKVLPTMAPKPKAMEPGPQSPNHRNLPEKPSPAGDRPPPALPPGIRSSQEKTDNPEQDYIADIFWNGDKDEANRVLAEIGQEGAYLIRSSENRDKVLVVYAEGGARKYKIQQNDGEVYIASENKFHTIQEMLDFYYTNELPRRRTMLTQPYNTFK